MDNIHIQEIYKLKQSLVIVLNKPWALVSEEEKLLLAKILVSIQQSLGSVQILHSEVYSINNLVKNSVVILFGAQASPEISLYTLVNKNGIQLVQADALKELDDAKKKNLWNAIRQIKLGLQE